MVLDQKFSIMQMCISLLPQEPIFAPKHSSKTQVHCVAGSAKEACYCCLVAEVSYTGDHFQFQGGDYNADRICREIAIHIHIRGTELHWQPVLGHLNAIA